MGGHRRSRRACVIHKVRGSLIYLRCSRRRLRTGWIHVTMIGRFANVWRQRTINPLVASEACLVFFHFQQVVHANAR